MPGIAGKHGGERRMRRGQGNNSARRWLLDKQNTLKNQLKSITYNASHLHLLIAVCGYSSLEDQVPCFGIRF
jgi:hypothetical protein